MGVIESVAEALHAACLRDLPAIEYLTHDQGQERQYLNGLSEADRKSYYESKRKVSESDRALSAFYAADSHPRSINSIGDVDCDCGFLLV